MKAGESAFWRAIATAALAYWRWQHRRGRLLRLQL